MPQKYNFIIGFLLSLLTAGCVLSSKPYHQPLEFDLGEPVAKNTMPLPALDLMPFSARNPGGTKFVYRTGKFNIKTDDYRRWAQMPSTLVTNFISGSYPDVYAYTGVSKIYTFTGTLIKFEFDLRKKEAVMVLDWTVYNISENKVLIEDRLTLRKVFHEETSEAMVRAMRSCAVEAARKIEKRLSLITADSKNKNKKAVK
jgi:hypothetical protein